MSELEDAIKETKHRLEYIYERNFDGDEHKNCNIEPILKAAEKYAKLLTLIENGILEDSQCGDTGEYGYFIAPDHREKIEELIGEKE